MSDTATKAAATKPEGEGGIIFHEGRPYIVVRNTHGAVEACPLGAVTTFYTDDDGNYGDFPFVRGNITDADGEKHSITKAPAAPKDGN